MIMSKMVISNNFLEMLEKSDYRTYIIPGNQDYIDLINKVIYKNNLQIQKRLFHAIILIFYLLKQ